MTINDTAAVQRLGIVRHGWQGQSVNVSRNTLTYAHCDVVARAMAGDSRWLPRYIGFIYGADGEPVWDGDARDLSYSALGTVISGLTGGNLQISPIALTPTISPVQGSYAGYAGNAVTYSAISESGPAAELGFTGSGFDSDGISLNDKLFGAVLLAKPNRDYIPVARVVFGLDSFPQKTTEREYAVLWQVAYF